jgi:hypothetical protein
MSGRSDNVVRLGCAEQAAIADEIRRYWQHVVDEGVPALLHGLIMRFEVSGGDNSGAAAPEPGQDAADGVIVLADFRRGDCDNPA